MAQTLLNPCDGILNESHGPFGVLIAKGQALVEITVNVADGHPSYIVAHRQEILREARQESGACVFCSYYPICGFITRRMSCLLIMTRLSHR